MSHSSRGRVKPGLFHCLPAAGGVGEERVTNASPCGMGQDPREPPRLGWAAGASPSPQARPGSSPAAPSGTDLPWSDPGITNLALGISTLLTAPSLGLLQLQEFEHICLKIIMCLEIQVLRQKSGVTFLEALSSDKLRLYWGQWDFFLRVLSGNWIRSVPKCFCKSDLCGKQRGTVFSLPLMAA